MKKIFIGIVILIILLFIAYASYIFIFISSFSAGTHGSIESYYFNASKYKLEEKIIETIDSSSIIRRDTSAADIYYNSDGYMTIFIESPTNSEYQYTFRFYGGEEHWKLNPTSSSIFICYLYDRNGMAISEGNENVGKNAELVKQQIELFEREFVNVVNAKIEEQ